ncbi:uncharacterized protein LOC122091162 [Macadamia integrifolia]|uniref:uncharacterized protein LOC122091162 n=1 Tax=Macadamia integrifolia TaxID=60698 RepID=UPI001C4F1D4D|nr:uncharacterized protein LOC122091162 [Macadamia integrifolia]
MQCTGLASLQNRLLKDIFKTDLDVGHYHRGKKLIEHHLCNEKVLLVLDDVDNKEQVDALAGELNWFGQGSRVIITTSSEHILNVAKVDKDKIYWLQRLDIEESLKLFSLHAFSMDEPPQEYMQLSYDMVRYSVGLPSILEMLGSYLSDISNKEEWKNTLRKLKGNKASISSLASLSRQRKKMWPMKDNPVGCHPLFLGTIGINNPVAKVSKVLGGCLPLNGTTTNTVGKQFTEGNLNLNGSTAIDRVDNKLLTAAEIRAATENFDKSMVTGIGGFGIFRWNYVLGSRHQHDKGNIRSFSQVKKASSSPATSSMVKTAKKVGDEKLKQSEEPLRKVMYLSCWGPN